MPTTTNVRHVSVADIGRQKAPNHNMEIAVFIFITRPGELSIYE
jgi:hypothetical protein